METELIVDIKNKSDLYASYMPFVKGGGIFINTQQLFNLGDEVAFALQLLEESEPYKLSGKVVWVTPRDAQGNRTSGVGIQLMHEQGKLLRDRIETYLTGTLQSDRQNDTM